MFVKLSIKSVAERLKALGFERTRSRRFRRFERANKGIELLEYHNLTELDLYVWVNKNYHENPLDNLDELDELRSELKEAFKGFEIESEN